MHKVGEGKERQLKSRAAVEARRTKTPTSDTREIVVIKEEERELWDHLPDEPEISFKRFDVYLRRGPGRKLQDVVDHFADTPEACGYGNMKWLSRQWDWANRAKAYDMAEQQRYQAITAQDRARDATKVSYISRRALDTLERLMDDDNGETFFRMAKLSSLKEINGLMGAAGDLYKIVHGTKTITEGDQPMVFNGPTQVNLSDAEKAQDLQAQISPYADIFRQIAAEQVQAAPAEEVTDAEFEAE